MPDEITGRRLRVFEDGTYEMPSEPGDYVGPVPNTYEGRPGVWFLLPNARDEGAPRAAGPVRLVCAPPHTFHEQPDGSLVIRESILAKGWEVGEVWHGFLNAGHRWELNKRD